MSCFLIVVPRNRHRAFDKALQRPRGRAGSGRVNDAAEQRLGEVSAAPVGLIETMRSSCFSCQERRMGRVLLLIAVTGTTGEGGVVRGGGGGQDSGVSGLLFQRG